MTDRPIIFSAPMVRALLDGRKTQTRRIIKKAAAIDALAVFGPQFLMLPGNNDLVGFAPGDRLWVREAWSAIMTGGWTIADARRRMFSEKIVYRADGHGHEDGDGWWPSIHMPREFSRLTLIVTDVRVQRLQDISEADAVAEGVKQVSCTFPPMQGCTRALRQRQIYEWPGGWSVDAVPAYRALWNSIHGPDAWGENPWVCAVTFKVHRKNIDQMESSQ